MPASAVVLCGRCKVPVSFSTSREPETTVRCPICGESDTLQNAAREAGQHSAYKILSYMLNRPANKPELFFRFTEE